MTMQLYCPPPKFMPLQPLLSLEQIQRSWKQQQGKEMLREICQNSDIMIDWRSAAATGEDADFEGGHESSLLLGIHCQIHEDNPEITFSFVIIKQELCRDYGTWESRVQTQRSCRRGPILWQNANTVTSYKGREDLLEFSTKYGSASLLW